MESQSTKSTVLKVLAYVFCIVLSIIVLYPIVFVLSGAFSEGTSMASLNIIPFSNGFTTEHFVDIFESTDYPKWYVNTLLIAFGSCISTVFIACLGAYTFSRFRFTMKRSFMLAMLVLQIFPSFIGMDAIYVLIERIVAIDTLWGLVLVYVAGNIPYNTWLVKSYLDTIPRSLDEAARIDGANHFTIFMRVVMPIAKPIVIFLAITTFTGPWMDYIMPKYVLRSPSNKTLAMGLFSFIDGKKGEFTNFSAGALLVAIPFIIFFALSQNMMVTSLGGAAVKE